MKKLLYSLFLILPFFCLAQDNGKLSSENMFSPKTVNFATTAALPTNTYSNGTSGVGATLTASSNGALSVDGCAPAVGKRILVNNEADKTHNGIYAVTQTGGVSTPWILTRTQWASIGQNLIAGTQVYVDTGATLKANIFFQTADAGLTPVIGSTQFNFRFGLKVVSPLAYNPITGTLTTSGSTSGITKDSSFALYVGVVRPSSSNGINGDMKWSWIIDPQHNQLGFTSAISAQGSSLGLFIPTCAQIFYVGVVDDETLQGFNAFWGASFQLGEVLTLGGYPVLYQGGRVRGNGTSSPDVSALSNGWTFTFSGGGYFMDYTGGILGAALDYNAMTMTYQGTNNYHAQRLLSGLGSHFTGFALLDAGGNLVTSNPTSADVVTFTGNGTLATVQMNMQTVNAANIAPFSSAFGNIWVLAVVSVNFNTPGPIVPITASAVSTTQINLTWSASTNASQYVVKRSTHPHDPSSFTTVFTGSALSFNDTGLTTGTKYYYWIEAQNFLGAGSSLLESGFEAVSATTL